MVVVVRKLTKDNNAVIPLIAWFIIGAVALTGTVLVLQPPDITYEISDTGFSIAGVDISFFAIIIVVIIVVFVIIWAVRRKPAQPTQPRQPMFFRQLPP